MNDDDYVRCEYSDCLVATDTHVQLVMTDVLQWLPVQAIETATMPRVGAGEGSCRVLKWFADHEGIL